jgi:tRNA(adenine34) deaminase
MTSDIDIFFMEEALSSAREAGDAGEVPVGAVVVKDGKIIGRGRNRTEEVNQAMAHAEMEALRKAGAVVGDWRLDGCTLYATLEPCPMCAFAALLARVDRLVFGAADAKFGGCGSVIDVPAGAFNHRLAVEGGVLVEASQDLLRSFFRPRRPGRR